MVAVPALAIIIYFLWQNGPDYTRPALTIEDQRINHPSDIIKFQGRYVATQLYDHRLAVFDDLELSNFEYLEPASNDIRIKSPHFLAIAPDGGLLISDGWGRSIIKVDKLDGGNWQEFRGVDREFRAPHGICVDRDGWIYVGDSLNSRLVRFRDMDGAGWQIFPDHDKRVSYIRELVCRDGAVLVSNSYENRPGLNTGQGSNILRITDFDSGRSEIVFEVPDANITGLQPLTSGRMLVGLWGAKRRLARVDTTASTMTEFQRLPLGTPYGMYLDADARQVLVTHIGNLSKKERNQNPGGIAVYQ